jgi:hypothetical protein
LDREDRRAYQHELKHLLAGAYPEKSGQKADKHWERLQSKAKTSIDENGRPILQMEVGNSVVEVGASAENILNGQAPPQLVRQLLEARLESELHGRATNSITEAEIERDWNLLQKSLAGSDSPLAARNAPRSQSLTNRP